jgi:hypothetical protein
MKPAPGGVMLRNFVAEPQKYTRVGNKASCRCDIFDVQITLCSSGSISLICVTYIFHARPIKIIIRLGIKCFFCLSEQSSTGNHSPPRRTGRTTRRLFFPKKKQKVRGAAPTHAAVCLSVTHALVACRMLRSVGSIVVPIKQSDRLASLPTS